MKKRKTSFNFLFGALIIAAVGLFALIEYSMFNKADKKPIVKPALAAKLIIATSKAEYKPSETVKIIMTNIAKNSIVEQPDSSVDVMSVRYLGKNYGVGLIEKFVGDSRPDGSADWIAIEPVWRCGDSCFAECKNDYSIKPKEKRVFSWKQTMLICDQSKRTEKIKPAGAGKYRISSAIWLDAKQAHKIIHSNEFIIK